jgi:phosphatidylserine decarboxylase
MIRTLLFRLLTELSSRPIIARWLGFFAKSKYSKVLIPLFASHFRIAVSEAEKSIEEYASLNEFFIRKLRPGARPINTDADQVVSPVDGAIAAIGEINWNDEFVVKGQRYSIKDLLQDNNVAASFIGGAFIVIYLSPSNYHRIHSPVDGLVTAHQRIPGKIYPVHDASMRMMPKVLSRNARLITYFSTPSGAFACVKVGAMNVSSIQYSTGESPPTAVMKGDDLAFFEFGSTVILCWERNTMRLIESIKVDMAIRMGESIGTLIHIVHSLESDKHIPHE